MSVTAEAPLVSAPAPVAMYMSRRSGLRLVKVPTYPLFGQGGLKIGETLGETIVFADGRLDVPLEGELTIENGKRLPVEEVRAFLDGHRLNRDQEDGFWLVPQVGPPVSEAELEAILNATMELDEAQLEQIVAQETAGWGRELIVNRCTAALERIRAGKEKKAEAEKAAKKPAAREG